MNKAKIEINEKKNEGIIKPNDQEERKTKKKRKLKRKKRWGRKAKIEKTLKRKPLRK